MDFLLKMNKTEDLLIKNTNFLWEEGNHDIFEIIYNFESGNGNDYVYNSCKEERKSLL